jgi:hypothetical protein
MIDQIEILDQLVSQLHDQYQVEYQEKVLEFLMRTVVEQKIKILILI